MALIDETRCGGGIGEAGAGHDERPRLGNAPANEVTVRRCSQDRPEFPRQGEPIEPSDRLEVA